MTRLVVWVAAALVLAACGGDSTSADEKWMDTARAACDERFETIDVASAQLTAQSTPEQFAAFFTQHFEPAYRKQLDAMRAAGPTDDEARKLIDDTATILDTMAANPGDFAVAADPFVDVDTRWDTYGLKECGTRT